MVIHRCHVCPSPRQPLNHPLLRTHTWVSCATCIAPTFELLKVEPALPAQPSPSTLADPICCRSDVRRAIPVVRLLLLTILPLAAPIDNRWMVTILLLCVSGPSAVIGPPCRAAEAPFAVCRCLSCDDPCTGTCVFWFFSFFAWLAWRLDPQIAQITQMTDYANDED